LLTAAAQAAFLLNLSIQRKKISSSASPLSIERRLLPVLKFSACSGRGLHGPGGGVKPGRRPRQVMVLYQEQQYSRFQPTSRTFNQLQEEAL
jgi:hypothetical protein